MPASILRILDQVPLTPGDTTQISRPIDLSDHTELELVIEVKSAGVATPPQDGATPETPTLVIKHAPSATPNTWLDLPNPVAVDLTTPGTTWIHVPYFTAFLGLSLTGRLDSPAVVTLEIVGKR